MYAYSGTCFCILRFEENPKWLAIWGTFWERFAGMNSD
ncbi:hypothetical protein B4099_1026 [Heyndrickxia coagulans]|uniref:Uncharacterized protein n=1 Tax=Heyndrickxia coagulans TaxID=1398 RepID=A0A150K4H0_HEYCO|nr:hypothetical protein B4099_1026 [Heyndrickxia coagulans]